MRKVKNAYDPICRWDMDLGDDWIVKKGLAS